MKFELKTSLLNRVDGSAEFTIGNTKLIASVTGPIEPKPRQELPTLASLEIVVRPSVGVSSTREKVLEDKLRSILQSIIIRYKYPRQLIQIVVQFLVTDDNSQLLIGESEHVKDYSSNKLNAAINCIYFALIDANIALYNSFSSVSISIPKAESDKKQMVINPTLQNLIESESHHILCFDIRDKKANKILLLESQGTFTEDELIKVIEEGSRQCESIHNEHQRKLIEEKVHRDFIWKS